MKTWIVDLLAVASVCAVGCEGPSVVTHDADDIIEDEDVVEDEDDNDETDLDVPAPEEPETTCTEHAHCASGACDLLDGQCFALEDVRIVDETTCDEFDTVHCTVSNALSTIEERGAVRVRFGGDLGPITVEGKRVAIVVERGYTATAPVLAARHADVMVEGLDLHQSTVQCDSGSLFLDRVQVEGGIPARSCYVQLRRSKWEMVFIEPPSNSVFTIENSFVRLDFGFVGEATSYHLDFTTVWSAFELAACASPPAGITARGSLLLGSSDWPDPTDCGIATDFHGNAGNTAVFDGPDGNQKLGSPYDLPLANPPLDLHILASDPFLAVVADLSPPEVDIDGDFRDPYRVIVGADAI